MVKGYLQFTKVVSAQGSTGTWYWEDDGPVVVDLEAIESVERYRKPHHEATVSLVRTSTARWTVRQDTDSIVADILECLNRMSEL